LTAHLSPSVHSGLATDLERRGRRSPSPPAIRAIRVCQPVDGVAEIAAVVQAGARYRAIAARLEAVRGGWCCVRLQIG